MARQFALRVETALPKTETVGLLSPKSTTLSPKSAALSPSTARLHAAGVGGLAPASTKGAALNRTSLSLFVQAVDAQQPGAARMTSSAAQARSSDTARLQVWTSHEQCWDAEFLWDQDNE